MGTDPASFACDRGRRGDEIESAHRSRPGDAASRASGLVPGLCGDPGTETGNKEGRKEAGPAEGRGQAPGAGRNQVLPARRGDHRRRREGPRRRDPQHDRGQARALSPEHRHDDRHGPRAPGRAERPEDPGSGLGHGRRFDQDPRPERPAPQGPPGRPPAQHLGRGGRLLHRLHHDPSRRRGPHRDRQGRRRRAVRQLPGRDPQPDPPPAADGRAAFGGRGFGRELRQLWRQRPSRLQAGGLRLLADGPPDEQSGLPRERRERFRLFQHARGLRLPVPGPPDLRPVLFAHQEGLHRLQPGVQERGRPRL